MNPPVNRRSFLRCSAQSAAALAFYGAIPGVRGANAPSRRIAIGVIGLGRGLDHVKALQQIPGVEVAWLCDIDLNRIAAAEKWLTGKQERTAKAAQDFRRILDDPEVEGVTIATPNFWHAPATILACDAGKHVYVEKPGSHNAQEGEWMVEAARRRQRKVQLGTQRRSWPAVIEMIQQLRSGVIGRVLSARTYYDNARPSIGRGKPAPVPSNFDYTLWQGPVPERPYVDNLLHYNWHWRWHWGGGELANNGPHALDLARWGLGVDYPIRVSCVGGRYHYDDDQETPDTAIATYDFGPCGTSFDFSSCNPRAEAKRPWLTFYGERGSVVQDGPGYKVYDPKGVEIKSASGPGGDVLHFRNWIDAIRDNTALNQEIEDGQRSTLLCHLGNIAYRLRREIHFDPVQRKIVGDSDARKLWSREYRPGWKSKLS
ncbi:MAG: Gfo/Idh/MocA family oxidoreductase [Verrucomicrobiales bacterium]|nr:Gfo/Idh/MocA family oxidoreductase [Verrucomicrobiales bacterium]